MTRVRVDMAEVVEFTPRDYQIDLYEKAIAGNTIIYLPTGSGKTYIVVMVIKKLSSDVRKSWDEGGKRTVFLVNTVPLVAQQCAYINRHSDLSCNGYSGDMNVDIWDANMWTKEFNDNQVLVMTAQILLDILNHGYLPLSRINLIIFDECHHAVGDHPMRLIMKRFEDCSPESQPKVLGTSATLLNANIEREKVDNTVHELEVTFNAKVITVDSLAPVVGFGKPTEYAVYFDRPVISRINEKLEQYINHAIEVLNVASFTLSNLILESSKEFQPKSKNVKLKCIFEDIRDHLNTKGLYFVDKAILFHMIQLDQFKRSMGDIQSIMVIDFLITQMTLMRKIIHDQMKGSSEVENMIEYSSDQVKKLFEVILQFKTEYTSDSKEFCCLIFVDRRFTAKVLYEILKCLAQDDERFKFVVPRYVVGYTTDPLKRPVENMCLQRWCREALVQFRAHDVNCLIATDVLDEGIDIPACKLVIRFDAPNNFRAYVQSKGRARHKDSHYIILMMKNSQLSDKYLEFRRVERTLSGKLIGKSDLRLNPLPEELKQNLYISEIEPFSIVNSDGSQAVITEVSAISIINRYCTTFSPSNYITGAPVWVLHENDEGSSFMVTLKMPKSSPLRDIIHGDIMPSVMSAKRSAAMKACKKLYEIGELNDKLLPKNAEDMVDDISMIFLNMQGEKDANRRSVSRQLNMSI